LHGGRCPKFHDAFEVFNVTRELNLTPREKDDLATYLLCL